MDKDEIVKKSTPLNIPSSEKSKAKLKRQLENMESDLLQMIEDNISSINNEKISTSEKTHLDAADDENDESEKPYSPSDPTPDSTSETVTESTDESCDSTTAEAVVCPEHSPDTETLTSPQDNVPDIKPDVIPKKRDEDTTPSTAAPDTSGACSDPFQQYQVRLIDLPWLAKRRRIQPRGVEMDLLAKLTVLSSIFSKGLEEMVPDEQTKDFQKQCDFVKLSILENLKSMIPPDVMEAWILTQQDVTI